MEEGQKSQRGKSPSLEDKKDPEDKEVAKKDEPPIKDTGDEPLVDRWLETDQDDRALLTANRVTIANPSYTVLLLNQYAARAHRQDFLAQILRVTYDFFVEHVHAQKNIQDMADEQAEALADKFVADNCSEYDLPCMDFYVNASDYE